MKNLRPEQILAIGVVVCISSLGWTLGVSPTEYDPNILALTIHFLIGVLIILYAVYKTWKLS